MPYSIPPIRLERLALKYLLFFLLLLGAAARLHAAGEPPAAASILSELNLARTQPRQYAAFLQQRMAALHSDSSRRATLDAIHFLEHVHPLPPLSLSGGMNLAAKMQVDTQGPTGAVGHSGPGNSSPADRISRFGKWDGQSGENVAYGFTDPRTIVSMLIIDEGVSGHGHRKNIFNPAFSVAGIACGSHARFGAMCVMDFATQFVDTARRATLAGNQSAPGAATPATQPLASTFQLENEFFVGQ